jgi:molecular chaperone DnaK
MKFRDGYTVGIDLGTSYSAIARLDEDGAPVVMENAAGEPVTPSILILGDDGRVIVGPTPERVAEEHPDKVIIAIKRKMGDETFEHYHEGRRLTPELISSMILTKLKQDAEMCVKPICNAVITVPYYFNEPKRQATRHAGRIAGLNVVDIINEPTAATLAYAWQKGELGRTDIPSIAKTIMVYDLGGGTFDVTIVRYTPTEFTVLATDGDTMLGGLDWTQRLVEFLADEFLEQFGLDPRSDPLALKALSVEAEAAKRELSLWEKSDVSFAWGNIKLEREVTRKKFEELTLDLLQRTRDTSEFVLDQAGISTSDLSEVLLVGGSTTMPAVADLLKAVSGTTPSRILNPRTAIAQGAAIHAAILEAQNTEGSSESALGLHKRLKSIRTLDVNSHSLGVEITLPQDKAKKYNHIMIRRNSLLPTDKTQRFVTNTDNPSAICVRLLEGEAKDVESCTFIGEFRLEGLDQNLPKGTPVEIIYGYDEQGNIHVSLRELKGNNVAHLDIEWSHGLDAEAIDTLAELAQKYHIE